VIEENQDPRNSVSRDELCQQMQGLQIAHVDHVPGEVSPWGGPVLGFEFTNSWRLAIMPAPDLRDGSAAPWVLKMELFVDEKFIWSPTPIKRLSNPTKDPGWYQEQVEGEIVEHFRILPELTSFGGEQLLVMWKNAGATLFRATSPPKGTPYVAGLFFQHFPKSKLSDAPVKI
jgi:hypothetical protein